MTTDLSSLQKHYSTQHFLTDRSMVQQHVDKPLLHISDEGDEDYDGQLQDYNKERLNTQEIRKELHLTAPSTLGLWKH